MAITLQECLISDQREGVCSKRQSPEEMEAIRARNKIRQEAEMEAMVRQHQIKSKIGIPVPKVLLKDKTLFWVSVFGLVGLIAYQLTKPKV